MILGNNYTEKNYNDSLVALKENPDENCNKLFNHPSPKVQKIHSRDVPSTFKRQKPSLQKKDDRHCSVKETKPRILQISRVNNFMN